MSSTLRLYANNERKATAVLTKKGQFLQVYPVKKVFLSEQEWRFEWTRILRPEITVQSEESKTWVPKKQAPATADNWSHEYTFKYTAPAGKYYIGDLCYVLGNTLYKGVFGKNGYESGLYTQKDTGNFFLVAGTAYGDGEYTGSDDRAFVVDAGIIGITPASCMTKNDGGGHIYTFEKPVQCTFGDGIFTFVVSGYTLLEIDTN